MQYNKLHVLGLQDDPGNFLRDAFVEIGTQIKGELVDDGTPFGIREFCAAFEQLDQVCIFFLGGYTCVCIHVLSVCIHVYVWKSVCVCDVPHNVCMCVFTSRFVHMATQKHTQRVQERYSQFGGRFARPVGPTV